MRNNYLHGGWYDGKQWDAGSQTLGEVGVINNSSQQGNGQRVSAETITQTDQKNLSFIDGKIQANQLNAPVNIPLSDGAGSNFVGSLAGQVEQARRRIDTTLSQQKAETEAKLSQLRERESQTLDKIGELSTPFREELETAERERLHVNKNFEENQQLTDELEQLLTEGNELIKQQSETTGLSSVRNPRIQKTINDVSARVGVIQAVMSARNGQIGQAFNMIDRSIGAIADDRNDQLNYYNTILNLNNRDILSLDSDSKKIAQQQTDLLKGDLAQAQATSDYVKQLMINPQTAVLMGTAGVSLNDNVETIQNKIAQAEVNNEIRDMANGMATNGYASVINPANVPKSELVTLTDANGNKHYFRKQKAPGKASVSDFLNRETSKGTSANDSAVLQDDALETMEGILNAMVEPNQSPSSGYGSRHTDELGRNWVYDSFGWRQIQ